VFLIAVRGERRDDHGEKIKGRLVAAEEKTGEVDIFPRKLSGNTVGGVPGDYFNFRFFFASMSIPLRPALVKRFGLNAAIKFKPSISNTLRPSCVVPES
jgi:hypothetical protein